jgi:hypothetical protein
MLTFPHHPPTIKMSAEYEGGELFALEGMSAAYNEGKREIFQRPFPTTCVFSCEVYVSDLAEWNGLKMSMKRQNA